MLNGTLSSSAVRWRVRGFKQWFKLAKLMESKWLGGSIVAWIALGVTLVGNAITYGATTAAMQGKVTTLEYTVQRNREESLDRVKNVEASTSNVYSSLAAINSIKTDVEVIKEQIRGINDSMRRMEVQRPGLREPR